MSHFWIPCMAESGHYSFLHHLQMQASHPRQQKNSIKNQMQNQLHTSSKTHLSKTAELVEQERQQNCL